MRRPLHICLVHGYFPPVESYGGIVRYLVALTRGYVGLGHRVSVVTRSTSGSTETDGFEGATVYRVPAAVPRAIAGTRLERLLGEVFASSAYARAIRRIARERPIDVVEFSNYGAEGLIHSLRKTAPHFTRVVTLGWQTRQYSRETSGRAARTLGTRWRDWCELAAMRRSDALLSPSEAHRRWLETELGRLPPIEVVQLGLGDTAPDLPDRPQAGGVRFLYVGKLEPRKGFDVAVRAFASAYERLQPHPSLAVVGEDTPHGPGGSSFAEAALRHVPDRAARQIDVRGWVDEDELEGLYGTCDVLVAPSRYESFGLMYVEAMRHAMPVLAARAGAAPEIVEDGETGLLVEPGSVESLARAMARLAEDPALRARLASNARAAWHERFTNREMCVRSLRAYESASASRCT